MREKDNFIDRLLWVLGPRKLYPWGMALGMSSATLARLKRGNSPKGETLAMIARAENCCASWLLTGQGSPYLVHHCGTDAETAALLHAHLTDEPWQVDLLHDTHQAVVVLTQPAEIGEGDAAVAYTAMEMISGPIGPESEAVLGPRVGRAVRVDGDLLRDAQHGRMGTYQALQILDAGEAHGGQRVAELAAQYGGGAFSPEEQVLVEKYRQLAPANRTHAQAVVGALAHAQCDAAGAADLNQAG